MADSVAERVLWTTREGQVWPVMICLMRACNSGVNLGGLLRRNSAGTNQTSKGQITGRQSKTRQATDSPGRPHVTGITHRQPGASIVPRAIT